MPLAAPDRAVLQTPMYWRREFPGTADQARAARRFVRQLLDGCSLIDDVLLAVDELVTNALHHTRSGRAGGRFTVEVRRIAAQVIVCVADEGGPTEPRALAQADPGDLDALRETGRGLHTVAALATHWSWIGDDCGRTVRAAFAARNRRVRSR